MNRGQLKLAVIGAGSTYTPELVSGVISRRDDLPVGILDLMDIDADRLRVVGGFAQRMVQASTRDIEVRLTTDRSEAVRGADYVVTQIRVGGMQARVLDEKIPLEYGVIGQETTGPGGFAKALRTIPVILDLCREMEELAPEAWLINFANPSGLVTEAALRYGRSKVIGLCNGPIGMTRRIASELDVAPDRVRLDYFGLNHLNWIRTVEIDGADRTGQVMDMLLRDAHPEEAAVVRALGLIPCAYLKYYYRRDSVIEELRAAEQTRGQQVQEIEAELLKCYADPTLHDKPESLSKRGGAFYSEAAIDLMADMHNSRNTRHIVNVRNQNSIDCLAPEAVVEVPCIVSKRGARPERVGQVPRSVRGLLMSVKFYEEFAARAAAEGDRKSALMALFVHPLVPSLATAEKLLEAILSANTAYLPQFVGR